MKPTHAEIMESMRHTANGLRDTADEIAGHREGCDDPLHPWGPQIFENWIDFTERVCRPLVEVEGDHEQEQAAMRLYRTACPHSIAVSLVMALNTIRRLEAELGVRDRAGIEPASQPFSAPDLGAHGDVDSMPQSPVRSQP